MSAVLASFVYVLSALLSRREAGSVATCSTIACDEYALRLHASLNHSVDPCQSFTHFVCDGWRKRHLFAVNEEAFGVDIERIAHIAATIDVPPTGQSMLQRGAMIYRTCTALLKRQRDELAEVKAALREAGVLWPHRPPPAERRDLVRMMLHCDYKLGWSAIFRLSYGTSRTKTDVYVLTDSGFNFILRKRLEFISKGDFKRRQYFEVLRDSFQDPGEEGKSGQADVAALKDVLALEDRMFSPLMGTFHMNAPWFFVVPDEVVYNAAVSLSQERWTAAFRHAGVNVQKHIEFRTWNLAFFSTFVRLWKLHGEQDMYDYVSWCTVQVAALFANSELIENFYDHPQRARILHGAFCLSRAYIGAGKDLLASFAHDVLPKSVRPSAEAIALAVRAAFRNRLSSWADYNDNVTVIRVWESKRMAFSMFEPWPETEFPDVIVGEMGDSFLENWRNAWLSRTFYRPVDIKVAITAIDTLAYTADIEYRKDFILLPYAFSFPLYDPAALPAINHGGFGAKVSY
ncbi:uncharacterized protein LOC144094363 [Amblyomma americanum]